jgi:hypothetical protein
MAGLLHAVTKIWDAIRSRFGRSVPAPSAEDVIHEFSHTGANTTWLVAMACLRILCHLRFGSTQS